MITLCVPSRGRPDRFAEMWASAREKATLPVECVTILDKDDATRSQYPRGSKWLKKKVVDRPVNMSELWDMAAKVANGDIVMLCADDVIFETEGWDERVEAEFAAVPDEILMVYTASGHDNRPILPFVSKRWVDIVGEFTPHDYQGWMADEFIWAIAAELRRVVYLDDVMIRHHQFERPDETYSTAQTRRLMQGGLEGMRRRFYSPGEVERRDRHVNALRQATDGTQFPFPAGAWIDDTLRWNAEGRIPERNPGVLVTVHCYQGDADNVRSWLPLYLHHGRPVLVMSPEDSPVVIDHPQVQNHSAGPRAYVGQKSMDRQRAHLEYLAKQPYDWFLMNDADSVCLSPDLPEFLFERDDALWSLHANEWRKHSSPYPKIGLHPPYFCSKKVIKKLLTAADLPQVRAHEVTPFIDWYMLALACESGVEIPDYPAPYGITWPAWKYNAAELPDNILLDDDHVRTYNPDGEVPGDDIVAARVAAGAVFVHSVKHPFVMERLAKIARDRAVALGGNKLVSILVPFTPEEGDTQREDAWRWVEARWRATVPDAEIVVGIDSGTPPGPYSKTAAVNDAYTRATGDVFVIADADAWMEPSALHRAVDVARRTNRLVVPWKFILRIDEEQSKRVMDQDPSAPVEVTEAMRVTAFNGPDPMSAGTMIVISREGFEAVEGMDPRFRGWGMEDVAFGRACATILGQTVYGNEEVVSLYHSRPFRDTGNGSTMRAWKGDTELPSLDQHPNIELAKLYDGAVNDRDRMLRVVAQHRLRSAHVPMDYSTAALKEVMDPKNVFHLPTAEFFDDRSWVQGTDETVSVPVDQMPDAEHDTFTMEIG